MSYLWYNYMTTPIPQAAKSCLSQPNKLSLNKPPCGWLALGLASLASNHRRLFVYPMKERRQKMNGVVYEIRNLVNSKRYVGSTVGLRSRKGNHFSRLRRQKHHSILLQRAFDKYGEAAFVFSVIEENIPQDYLVKREQYWLDKLQPEYNIAKSASAPMMGLHHSDKARASMSATRKGRSPHLEWRRKLSDARKGYVYTLEVRKKISVTLTGNTNAPTKQVQQIDPNTNKIIRTWSSEAQAARELSISKGNLSMVVTGKRRTAGGFIWRHLDDDRPD